MELLEYTPFGSVAFASSLEPSASSPFKFTGQRLDASTGLYFFHARYYDPQLGRFISPDTIVQAPADPQSLNRYAYARNNPLKYVDPSGYGFWSWLKGLLFGSFFGGEGGGGGYGQSFFIPLYGPFGVGYNFQQQQVFVGFQVPFQGGYAQAGFFYNFHDQQAGLVLGAYTGSQYAEAKVYYDFPHDQWGASYEYGSPYGSVYANTDGQRYATVNGQQISLKGAKASLQGIGMSPQAAESFLKTTPKVVAPALGAIYNSLNAAKYQDLWANARYNRFGPGVRTAWSGVQGVSLFLGGLNLVEPYSRVGISLTVNQAQAISAIRGIRLTAVTYAAGKGAFAGFALGGGPAGIPLSLVTASAGAVVAGAGADFVFGRIEDWVLDWAGYPSQ